MTNLDAAVLRAAELLSAEPGLEEFEVSEQLVAEGLSLELAERTIAFVPTAFGRRFLAKWNMTFEDGYEIRDYERQLSFKGVLQDDEVFRAAEALAENWASNRESAFVRIVSRDAVVGVVEQSVRGGSVPSDLRFTEALFLRIPLSAEQGLLMTEAASTPAPTHADGARSPPNPSDSSAPKPSLWARFMFYLGIY